ncbi:hypothetical protein TNCV_2567701 [Trichonephila clavipes]|uniref:Uncharacterized protein n=1 Tax=Trichonephila clavipes TaxID=2585209 RepID=A0A8X6WKG8_TRICX|nr:hypothetical protein TNCV_2567701 [Trichonephila clavipes]
MEVGFANHTPSNSTVIKLLSSHRMFPKQSSSSPPIMNLLLNPGISTLRPKYILIWDGGTLRVPFPKDVKRSIKLLSLYSHPSSTSQKIECHFSPKSKFRNITSRRPS